LTSLCPGLKGSDAEFRYDRIVLGVAALLMPGSEWFEEKEVGVVLRLRNGAGRKREARVAAGESALGFEGKDLLGLR